MKTVKAVSRCEVGGKVYVAGDSMEVSEEQLTFLVKQGAAVVMNNVPSATPLLPPNATIADADAHYERLVGSPRPKKGNRK